ncbi:MAG: type II secretion system minor pseudopilin GspK [Pseudomonadales bacterium]|nr:type II secretion system minor pseudopilin GspK [Pseudomonadales bacterium]
MDRMSTTRNSRATDRVHPNVKPQAGVALITVLLIVALLTALVYHLMVHQSLVLAKAGQMLNSDRAMGYAKGGEVFARQILYKDWKEESSSNTKHDSLLEAWAQTSEPLTLEQGDGWMEISIVDLRGRFNLNSLNGENTESKVASLKRLFAALNVDIQIADVWRDWIDSDSTRAGYGAEDSDYLSSDPPYRAANQPAQHISELRLLKMIDNESYQTILPHVAVLPNTDFRININTASAATLQSVTNKMTESVAYSLVEAGRDFTSVSEVQKEIAAFDTSAGSLTVRSDYFEVQVRVDIHGSRMELTSLIHRDLETGTLSILSRDYSRRFAVRQRETDAETNT